MKKRITLILFLLVSTMAGAQDLNCIVEILTSQVQITNKQIFEDMKVSMTQFMNNRKWVNEDIQPNEKIDCVFQFNITMADVDNFKATLTIQSTRPVYNSSYNTPLFRYIDKEVEFTYVQFQNLEFQENTFSSNLTSVLGFYAYLIIGLDYDSYGLKGGDDYLKKAQQIRQAAQNMPGWNPNDGNGVQNRYYLIENMLDPRFQDLRVASYIYHIKGMDVMHESPEKGRAQVYESLKNIKNVYDQLPNSFVLRLFFNAKRDELIGIFSDGTPTEKNRAVELLGKMDIANKSKYEDGIMKR